MMNLVYSCERMMKVTVIPAWSQPSQRSGAVERKVPLSCCISTFLFLAYLYSTFSSLGLEVSLALGT